MRSHPYIEGVVRGRQLIYVYGPPASGKTRLGVHVARLAQALGYGVSIIATEAGSSLAYRTFGEATSVALTMDDMAMRVAQASLRGDYVIVDTVNSFYRESPDYRSRSLLAMACAFAKLSGGMVIGQSSAAEDLPSPGGVVVEKYAEVVGTTRRLQEGKFALEITKPQKKVTAFALSGDDLIWL